MINSQCTFISMHEQHATRFHQPTRTKRATPLDPRKAHALLSARTINTQRQHPLLPSHRPGAHRPLTLVGDPTPSPPESAWRSLLAPKGRLDDGLSLLISSARLGAPCQHRRALFPYARGPQALRIQGLHAFLACRHPLAGHPLCMQACHDLCVRRAPSRACKQPQPKDPFACKAGLCARQRAPARPVCTRQRAPACPVCTRQRAPARPCAHARGHPRARVHTPEGTRVPRVHTPEGTRAPRVHTPEGTRAPRVHTPHTWM